MAETVELALAALVWRGGLPPDAAFALFARRPFVGWVADALEAAAAGTLIPPRAVGGPATQAVASRRGAW